MVIRFVFVLDYLLLWLAAAIFSAMLFRYSVSVFMFVIMSGSWGRTTLLPDYKRL